MPNYLPNLPTNLAPNPIFPTQLSKLHPRHLDMSSPVVVFAGLMLTAFAICSAVETHSMNDVADEVGVLNQENVAGPLPQDIIAMCKRDRKNSTMHCHEKNGVVTASLIH